MLINKNIENAARIAMGPLVLEEAPAEIMAGTRSKAVRLAAAAALVVMVLAAAIALVF
jgi:hypothetical protein